MPGQDEEKGFGNLIVANPKSAQSSGHFANASSWSLIRPLYGVRPKALTAALC